VAQSVSELSVKPAKAVTSWLTDQIAPAYWKPNSLISVSDTQPLPLPPTVNTFLSRAMFTVCVHLHLLRNPCLQVTRQNLDKVRLLSSWSIKFLLLLFFSCTSCAISVAQSSRTTTPSITAVPVGRATATDALPKWRPSRRGAGVLPPSESVTSASNGELHPQVHAHSTMSIVFRFSSSSCDAAEKHLVERCLRKAIFSMQSRLRPSWRRKKVVPWPGRLGKQSPTLLGSWSLLLTSHLVSVARNKT